MMTNPSNVQNGVSGRGMARLARSRSAIAATEFALILPLILVFATGMLEVVNRLNQDRKLKTLASTMAQLIARKTTPLTAAEGHYIYDSTMVLFPQVLAEARRRGKNWWDVAEPTFTSVEFKPTNPSCTSSCVYEAHVMWTAGRRWRPCGKLNPISPTADPDKNGIPSNLYGPGTLIVVDVRMEYNPLISFGTVGQSEFNKVAYIAPRYKERVDAIQSGMVKVCP